MHRISGVIASLMIADCFSSKSGIQPLDLKGDGGSIHSIVIGLCSMYSLVCIELNLRGIIVHTSCLLSQLSLGKGVSGFFSNLSPTVSCVVLKCTGGVWFLVMDKSPIATSNRLILFLANNFSLNDISRP